MNCNEIRGSRTTANTAPIGVSIGDPAGIGPDILLKTWARVQAGDIQLPSLVVFGDVEFLNKRAHLLGIDVIARLASDISDTNNHLPVIALENRLTSRPAQSEAADAAGVIEAIEKGVSMIAEGTTSALVTLPINKKHLYDSGFSFPGHTEYLAQLASLQSDYDKPPRSVMMLAGPELRTVPVTIHMPLSEVTSVLTQELIVDTAKIVHLDLKKRFGIPNPRLAFAGLNPHAGEMGALGTDEIETIEPALKQLRSQGVHCIGPLPADTMFHARARERYDVAICMYHDQALIPAKALAFDESVNVTLGLPFIRTSPDHGTAYDIAGTGKANPASFMAALNMAASMVLQSTTNDLPTS